MSQPGSSKETGDEALKKSSSEENVSKKYPIRCCISHCKNGDLPSFPFPSNNKYRKEWEEATCRSNVKSRSIRVCKKHFDELDFVRDLKSELLGLPPKLKLRHDAVPHVDLEPTPQDEKKDSIKTSADDNPTKDQSSGDEENHLICAIIKKPVKTRSGRTVSRKSQKDYVFDFVEVREPETTEANLETEASSTSIENNSHNIVKSAVDYSLPTSIPKIKRRLGILRHELASLRKERAELTGRSLNDWTKDLDKRTELEDLGREVSADDIRQRYRAKCGFKTDNIAPKLLNRPLDKYQVCKENEDKLFHIPINSMILKGSPQVTAEYFVNELVKRTPKTLETSKSELLSKLKKTDLNSVIIFDKSAFHLWQINCEAKKQILEPLEKLHNSTKNDVVVTRPRQRYFSERKLKYLEPELKKWKDQYENLRKFRKSELNKMANVKWNRVKRNAKRKKRRDWISEQIKEGKLQKNALLWVNSNKVLPFERKERKSQNAKKRPTEENDDDFEMSDESLEQDDEEMSDFDQELDEAVKSIQKIPKDSIGKVKRSTFVGERT